MVTEQALECGWQNLALLQHQLCARCLTDVYAHLLLALWLAGRLAFALFRVSLRRLTDGQME